jgi:D-alanyl-D-alanine carboxypeptidase
MRHPRHYQTFWDALPRYDVETPTAKKQQLVRAKSGGMSGVSTISGYVQTVEGRQLAFSLLGNGFIGTSKPVQALREKVWRLLVQYRP